MADAPWPYSASTRQPAGRALTGTSHASSHSSGTAQWVSWPWVFSIHFPIALGVLAVVPGLMPGAPPRRGSIDFAGALTATAGLALTVFSVVRVPEEGWSSAATLGVSPGAVALLGLVVVLQASRREPLMPLGLFPVAAGMIVMSFVRPGGSFVVDVLPASLIAAARMSLGFMPALGTAIRSTKPEQGGRASAIVNTSYQVGPALGARGHDRARVERARPHAQDDRHRVIRHPRGRPAMLRSGDAVDVTPQAA